jgi:glyoxalase family protein
MAEIVKGLHHITAIAGDAKRNLNFYTKILGLRLVKKTVNFDDPGTYHLYYGNESGEPGTLLTFFPWEDVMPGRRGTGMATEIAFSIPQGSMDFWLDRVKKKNLIYNKPAEKFGEPYLTILDPDGLKLELTIPAENDNRKPWVVDEFTENNAIRGFHHVTLTQADIKATADILTSVFGYSLKGQNVNRHRFHTNAIEGASMVDLVEAPGEHRGEVAGGTVHHVAFRVKDEATLMHYREIVEAKGLHITPKIDRNYFYSIYFREPGGVLFELATENPGFAIDEPLEELGKNLKLPPQYEPRRAQIEKSLPIL